jgi:hypothetical protein
MEVRAVLSVLSSTCFLQLRIVQAIDFVLGRISSQSF